MLVTAAISRCLQRSPQVELWSEYLCTMVIGLIYQNSENAWCLVLKKNHNSLSSQNISTKIIH